MELYTNLRAGEKGAWVSIGTYLFLSAMKLIVGYIGGSEALKADGLNNTTDIIASIAVLIGLKISQRPPDENHRYGHLRAETVASLVASFIMVVVGIEVIINSVMNIINPVRETPSTLTAYVALGGAAIMYVVYRYNLALSKKIKSSALKAAAYDNRSDALVSVGTAVGIFAAIFGFPIIDTITALVIGMLIIKTAFDIFWESAQTLTDAFDTEEIETLATLIKNVDGVIDLVDIKGRTHGNATFIEVTVTVNPDLNVRESHRITEKIEQTIQRFDINCTVLVHIEPHETEKPEELKNNKRAD
ncbi:cation diffusion facilitator family transporter [Ureibacillus sp. FSL K6-8385]|uniref:Cation transporter n=1 Tax=Ureibacillus terrenus TaxID=118246 RepID=A0A540V1Z4_9BACL|nr:cation diffusion facilitator family transporter [Ureibacillus terrenus]MED3661078.1 cation diffusion facilitator family transporter [Ureibacillus terrenus]MED3763367.1 cation diffusion facilitator family transporter [Ureibacillus terrenus]TQE90780.1 cation transporter [Ureibacillus terrenus]